MRGHVDSLLYRFRKACTEGCAAVNDFNKSPINQIRKSYLKKYILVSIVGIFPLAIDLCFDYMVVNQSMIELIEKYSVKGSFIWTFITVGLCAIMDGSFFWSQQGKNDLNNPNKFIYNAIWFVTIIQLIYYVALNRNPIIHINKVKYIANISIGLAITSLVLCFLYQFSLASCSYHYSTYLERATLGKGFESYAK